ncbi:MAG: histidine phosphatase family protein [Actinomycetota bacterium]
MDTDGQTTLLMIRHGQSTWNLEHRWQGQADPPLSEHGRKQALIASESIGAVDAVVSSPQIRALETATIISEQIGVGPVQTLDGLREREAGIWSGMTTTEIENDYPGWIDAGRRPEGWEANEVLLPRILGAIGEIVAEFGSSTLLVVCHGGVIVELEDHLSVRDGRTPNLHGRVVHIAGERLRPGDRLELIPPELSTGGTGGRV